MNAVNCKVSVIVPMYNVGRYIANCIESIQKQTYSNIEIVLVDDGSPDESGQIAETYAKNDSRIKVIHKHRGGVSAARNTGIEASSGDYICFVDGDDYVMPDYVEYMLTLIQEDADITLTTSMFGNFDDEQTKNDVVVVYTPERATEQILCYNIPIGVYCKLFKRSFLGNEIRFIEELFIGEGFNFNTTAFQKANKVIAGHRKTYYYRRDNPTSATTKFSIEKWENGVHAIDVIKENFILHSEKLEKAWEFAYWRTYSDVYDVMVLAKAEKQHPEMYRKCKKVIRTKGHIALKVPVSKQNRMRALMMCVCPRVIPWMMVQRRRKYHAEV